MLYLKVQQNCALSLLKLKGFYITQGINVSRGEIYEYLLEDGYLMSTEDQLSAMGINTEGKCTFMYIQNSCPREF